MKFESLYNLISEVPHVEIIGDADIEPGLSKLIAIDYCVEKWLISNEIKMSIAKSLYELTGIGFIPFKKGQDVFVHNSGTGKSLPLIEHQDSIDILESHDIDISKFIIDFINNENYFKYCTEDKCFTRKKKSGSDFMEFED